MANDRESFIDRQVELSEAKREISLEILALKKIKPTEALIRELMGHENVVAEAERRVSAREKSIEELRGEVDFKSIPLPKPKP